MAREYSTIRLLTAVEQSANSIVVTDLDGNITYVNKAFEKMTGYSKQEVLGQNPKILKSGYQDSKVYSELWATITQGETWQGQFKNKKKDGTFFWESVLITPIRNENNRIIEYLAVKENITGRKEAEESLAEAKEELEKKAWGLDKTNEAIKILYKDLEKKNDQLKKLDQLKSDFVSTVSHELRTPLAISIEGINLVLDGLVGDVTEQQRDLLQTSKDNLRRLNNIINDLLDISKIEAGKITLNKKLVDINILIKELSNSYLNVLATKKQKLNVLLSSDEICSYIDADKLIQIITNLLNNAHKFTPESGEISIFAELKDNEILITVKDTGVGISSEDLSELFKKFKQFGRQDGPGTKGTGLGLAISKALVEMHGGRIWAESKIGVGTEFKFALPIYDLLREKFDVNFDSLIKESKLNKKQLTFILINLDSHKTYKSKYGDDKYIKCVNKILECLPNLFSKQIYIDLLYTPNLIYIVLPETDKFKAAGYLVKLRKIVNEMKIENKDDFEFKFGSSMLPLDGETKEELIDSARIETIRDKNILIVDDHPQIINILKARLNYKGVQTDSAEDGEIALDMIYKKHYDLIILDIMMPNMNGYEVLGRLKQNPKTANIPVIILTAKNEDTVRRESGDFGFVPVVSKTSGFEKLNELIKEMLT